MSKLIVRVGLPALTLLALAGCGSSKSSTTASTAATAPAGTPAVNAAIAAQVPAAIKSKGTLDAYPIVKPFESNCTSQLGAGALRARANEQPAL